jgi:hypothetical protein
MSEADNKDQKDNQNQDQKPENDVLDDLFPEKKEETPITPVLPEKKDEVDGEKKEEAKIDTAAIVKEAVSQAVEAIKPMIGQQGSEVLRRRDLDNWIASDDGQLFIKYKDTIEKAALDPRFAGLRISQIPAAILKPTVYARILTEAKAKADEDGKDSKVGGDSARGHEEGDEKAPDYSQMSREDFEKVVKENEAKIKRQ